MPALLLKFLVDLYLENEDLKRTLHHQHFVGRMQNVSNSQIEAVRVSLDASRQRGAWLENQRQELIEQLSTVQEEKEKLQQDYNTLQKENVQCRAELEDERKDKQMYKQISEHQSASISGSGE